MRVLTIYGGLSRLTEDMESKLAEEALLSSIPPMLLCAAQGPPADQCRDLESFLVGPLNVRLLSDDFLSPGIVGQQNRLVMDPLQ